MYTYEKTKRAIELNYKSWYRINIRFVVKKGVWDLHIWHSRLFILRGWCDW